MDTTAADHPSHDVRPSDVSAYDRICFRCWSTSLPNGGLNEPCSMDTQESGKMDVLKRCPFCDAPMALRGFPANPYGKCETEGCYMRERQLVVSLDDPRQVAAWNRRLSVPDGAGALREALRPFAERANRYDEIPGLLLIHDDVELWQIQNNKGMEIDIAVGDLRRARQALASMSGGNGVTEALSDLKGFAAGLVLKEYPLTAKGILRAVNSIECALSASPPAQMASPPAPGATTLMEVADDMERLIKNQSPADLRRLESWLPLLQAAARQADPRGEYIEGVGWVKDGKCEKYEGGPITACTSAPGATQPCVYCGDIHIDPKRRCDLADRPKSSGATQITEEEVKRIAEKECMRVAEECETWYSKAQVEYRHRELTESLRILTAAGCTITGPKL